MCSFYRNQPVPSPGSKASLGLWALGVSWQGAVQVGLASPSCGLFLGCSGRRGAGWVLKWPCLVSQPTCLASRSRRLKLRLWGILGPKGVAALPREEWGTPRRDPQGWPASGARPPCTLSCLGPPVPCRYLCLHRPQGVRTCSQAAGSCCPASLPGLQKN